MFKLSLVLLCCSLAALPTAAQKGALPPQTTDPKQIEAVKFAVAKIGIGPKAKVEVVRKGKPKVKGIIHDIRWDDFDVISTQDGSIGMKITINYSEVVKIKGKGIDWSAAGAKASLIGLKSLKVMADVLKGACFGPISRCSP